MTLKQKYYVHISNFELNPNMFLYKRYCVLDSLDPAALHEGQGERFKSFVSKLDKERSSKMPFRRVRSKVTPLYSFQLFIITVDSVLFQLSV